MVSELSIVVRFSTASNFGIVSRFIPIPTKCIARAIVEAKKTESAHVHHNWVRILALIPCLVAAANLLYVQLDLSIQLSISLSIQL